MAYAFRIHETKKPGATAPAAPATMSGWTKTNHIAGNLLNNIELGVTGNKMGTSIPSIFARIFLFEGAFQTLDGAALQTLTMPSIDTQLVSECFDLIEFVYQHGNDPQLVVKRWNANVQIANLRMSNYDEHKELAKVIEDEVKLYPSLSDIYLFFWKAPTSQSINAVETLIGGTSPFTLVFTSPNWKKSIAKCGYVFNGLNAKPLFSNTGITSLNARGESFKNMIYSMYMAYDGMLNQQAPHFRQYIFTMKDSETALNPSIAAMAGSPQQFLAKYSFVHDDMGGNVQVYQLPICYEEVKPQASGYEIKATSNRYQTYTAVDGTIINLSVPLALNENGLGSSVNYVGTSAWDSTTCRINEANVRTTEMHERTLPGHMGIKYPFLIWSDFLEDKIIKLPYSQDSDNFVTATDGEMKYVLPLKRTFFKYFNIEDISANITGTNKKLVEVSFENNKVIVILNIPISDDVFKTIEFKRIYENDNIIDKSPFLLGFYPFYKITDSNLNRYDVLNCGVDTTLSFYGLSDLNRMIHVSSRVRTRPGNVIKAKTEYYCLKTGFDIVEVNANGCKGLIIPKMKVVGDVSNAYKFAVDFGTSNTYIAHTTTTNIQPTTLEIDEHDAQTVFLTNQTEKGQTLGAMMSAVLREFMPVAIGKHTHISYPCRTAICEVIDFEVNPPELFSSISIGFNMMNEKVAVGALPFKYKTGLKWLLEHNPGDPHHTNRVKYYFLQTLWMLKNESFLNGGDDKFEVYITFPETMKSPTKTALMNQWEWAKTELGLNCVFYSGTAYSESIAPYNCLATSIGGSSYLNVDIGGGTNDLLFVLKDSAGHIQSARYSSAMFAGDDLWGDGVVISKAANNANGFVDYLLNGLDGQSGILANAAIYQQEMQPLNALLNGVSTSSADIMGYLFKHDAVFNTSTKIQGCANLYTLIFIHYAAIIYNVSRLINSMNIEIPEKMSFTGMGSKYINLISPNVQIQSELTKLLLKKYTGKNVPNAFTIIPIPSIAVGLDLDVKEITAKGVLSGLALAPGFQIPVGSLTSVDDYGFNTAESITYNDVYQNPEVKIEALKEFNKFVDSLQDTEFINFLFKNFDLTISKTLLDDLKKLGQQSFVTMSASIPAAFNDLQVNETLFFWPLKTSLIEISRNYANY